MNTCNKGLRRSTLSTVVNVESSEVLDLTNVKSSNAAHKVHVSDYKYNILPLDFNMLIL